MGAAAKQARIMAVKLLKILRNKVKEKFLNKSTQTCKIWREALMITDRMMLTMDDSLH